jgi:hypothetical protein
VGGVGNIAGLCAALAVLAGSHAGEARMACC